MLVPRPALVLPLRCILADEIERLWPLDGEDVPVNGFSLESGFSVTRTILDCRFMDVFLERLPLLKEGVMWR